MPHRTAWPQKRSYPAPKPRTDLPYSQLLPAQQNAAYTKALHDYGQKNGPNPGSKGDFHRAQLAAETKT